MDACSRLQIVEMKWERDRVFYDFVVDGQLLTERLGISDRPGNLCFCNFGLDWVAVDHIRFPHYDRLAVIENTVAQLTGKGEPCNQFGTPRVVLYRCHCGCELCSAVSLALSVSPQYVRWDDIRFEDDYGEEEDDDDDSFGFGINPIVRLTFDRDAYFGVFEEYLQLVRRCAQERPFPPQA